MAVIGAGLACRSAALHAARSGMSVVVLEAAEVAAGGLSWTRGARSLYGASFDALGALLQELPQTGPGSLRQGGLILGLGKDLLPEMQRELVSLSSLGPSVRLVRRDEMETVIDSPLYEAPPGLSAGRVDSPPEPDKHAVYPKQ